MEDNKLLTNALDERVDVTSLVKYLDKVKELHSINKMMGTTYLRDFIEGQDVAGLLVAKAIQADIRAKAALERAEAIAYLDNAADYLKAKSVKDTSEARKQYVSIDPGVIAAQDKRAQTEAMVVLFKNKLSILRQAHDDLRKILYGDSYSTGFEGM